MWLWPTGIGVGTSRISAMDLIFLSVTGSSVIGSKSARARVTTTEKINGIRSHLFGKRGALSSDSARSLGYDMAIDDGDNHVSHGGHQ